jgi:hypothetical protein
MTWTFIWLMLLLKIPIGGMLWIVWWAIHKTDEEPANSSDDDGGGKRRLQTHRHPHAPRGRGPLAPRRGPHAGAPAPSSPPRTRSVVARARKVEH